jgi:hypothetical protein
MADGWDGIERRRNDRRLEERRLEERRVYRECPNPLIVNLLAKSANTLERLREAVADCLRESSQSERTRQELKEVYEFALTSEAVARGNLEILTQTRGGESGIER